MTWTAKPYKERLGQPRRGKDSGCSTEFHQTLISCLMVGFRKVHTLILSYGAESISPLQLGMSCSRGGREGIKEAWSRMGSIRQAHQCSMLIGHVTSDRGEKGGQGAVRGICLGSAVEVLCMPKRDAQFIRRTGPHQILHYFMLLLVRRQGKPKGSAGFSVVQPYCLASSTL